MTDRQQAVETAGTIDSIYYRTNGLNVKGRSDQGVTQRTKVLSTQGKGSSGDRQQRLAVAVRVVVEPDGVDLDLSHQINTKAS